MKSEEGLTRHDVRSGLVTDPWQGTPSSHWDTGAAAAASQVTSSQSSNCSESEHGRRFSTSASDENAATDILSLRP